MNKQIYKDLHDALLEEYKYKMGDTVKVLRKAESYELGWDAIWSESMDVFVGNVYEISEVNKYGVELYDGEVGCFTLPLHVIERGDPPLMEVEINDEYTAIIQTDGSVKVGCQHISYDVLNSIHKAAYKTFVDKNNWTGVRF
jgi:hypothetical protein|tara:strand:+ start:4093 stop:4518 length:426 start_codon:yes stop_codon:yes gene_type:complete